VLVCACVVTYPSGVTEFLNEQKWLELVFGNIRMWNYGAGRRYEYVRQENELAKSC